MYKNNFGMIDNIKVEYVDDMDSDSCNMKIVISRGYLRTLMIFAQMLNLALGEKTREITPREKEVLIKMSEGKENDRIAKEMFISVHTVKMHNKSIFDKLEANGRVQAVVKAIKYKIIDIFSD